MANLSYKNDNEADERLDPASVARTIQNQENEAASYAGAGVDQAEAFANDSSNATKQQEENPSNPNSLNYTGSGTSPNQRSTSRFSGIMKAVTKKGPMTFIVSFLLGGGALSSFLLSPGLLLVQIKEVLTNDGSDSSRAATARYNQTLKYMIGNKTACKVPGIKCKLATMSDVQRKSYEAAGFTIDGDDVDGRRQVTKVTFPDGKEVTSGDAFASYLKKNPSMASAASKGFNAKTAIFNGGRFSAKVLSKFGVTKAPTDLSGDDKKKTDEKFDKASKKLSGTDADAKGTAITEEARGRFSVAGGATAIPSIGCAGYNVSRVVLSGVKVANTVRLVSFAMIFLKAADQIKAGDATDDGTITDLGDRLTSYDPNKTNSDGSANDKYGLSATDAQGFKIAAYGNEGLLTKFAQLYMLGGSPKLLAIDKSIQWVQDKFGKRNIRLACKTLNSPGAQAAQIAWCAGDGAAAGSIFPGLGTATGLIGGLVGCIGAAVVVGALAGVIMGHLIEKAIPFAIDALKEAPIDSSTKGVDAGNAIAAGAGAVLGTASLSRGMKPANKKESANFVAATAESEKQDAEIAQYNAKSTPFDVYNQYSFLGSIIRTSGMTYQPQGSIAGQLKNISSILTSSLSLTPKALASDTMPTTVTEERLSQCPDANLTDIGIDCDRMGQVRAVLSTKELSMSNAANLDYMINNNQIDATSGQAIPDSQYSKFVQYCTEQRQDPLGIASEPIEQGSDEDQAWYTGEMCVKASGGVSEDMLSNFRVNYWIVAEKQDADEEVQQAGGPGLNVMSYNILGVTAGKDNHNDGGIDWKKRLANVLTTVTTRQPDIIGFQEMQHNGGYDQHKLLVDGLSNIYDHYPDPGSGSSNGYERTIFWNKSEFGLVDKGTYDFPRYDSNSVNMPWVKLQSIATGANLYVFNMHNASGKPELRYNPPQQRKASAEALVAAIKKNVTDGSAVITTGDYNSMCDKKQGADVGVSVSELPCSILTAGGMTDSESIAVTKINAEYDTSHTNVGDQQKHGQHIDHVFVSSGIAVNSWETIIDDTTKASSDHTPIIVSLAIPGFGTSAQQTNVAGGASKDGWVWPIQKDLFPGPCYGGSTVHAGMDINTKNANNPLLAAHDGVVESVPTGGAGGNQIRVKTTNGLYYWYEHMKSPSSLKPGDQVFAGKTVLGIAGKTGNVQVAAGYQHFHFVVMTKNDYPSYGKLGSSIDPMTVLPTPAPEGYKCKNT
ncbi:MAG: peptidoglycan DD-metalloendopeptidase family protein [Candidatus Saccharibacteria bacterium]